MGKQVVRPQQETSSVVEVLERKLQSSMGPVRPDPAFVYRLHGRLVHPPNVVIERRTRGMIFVLIALWLSLGVMMICLVRRIVDILLKVKPAG